MSDGGDTPESNLCPECGGRFDSMDRLVDHLTDDHRAFDWVLEGRPMPNA